MTLAYELKMSTRGWQAAENGLLPLDSWNIEILIRRIIHVKLTNTPCPKICFDDLKSVPLHILGKFCLWKAEWHHVNFRPCWFYAVDDFAIINMTQNEVEEMKHLAEYERPDMVKPTFARLKMTQWKTSTTKHEYCSHFYTNGVVYGGYVYFANGNRVSLSLDHCEIEKIIDKKTKKQKETFNLIRKRMRAYNIHC